MRQCFEDSLNMNILNWKINQKINYIRTWNSQKAEFLSQITSFLPLKFECANHIFPIPSISFTFHVPEEYSFYFFAKIMGGNCFLLFKLY